MTAFPAVATTEYMMTVESDLLGTLDVDADELIEFPAGMFGFPECRSFVLLPAEREGLFWLQSTEHSTLAFLLMDPFRYFPGYAVELPAGDQRELKVREESDVAILAVVTLPRSQQEKPTANLQGPVAVNLRGRVGKQLALSDSDHGVRRKFELLGPASEA